MTAPPSSPGAGARRARARSLTLTLALAGALAAAGCGGGEGGGGAAPPDADPNAGGGDFVAFARDFQDLLDWPRFPVVRPPIPMVHESGRYLVFINKLPPPGAREFPTGTIIAKIPQGPGETFAMAKRGGSYNSRGARGWEWFELKQQPDGTFGMAWRGITPPEGCGYSGIVGGGCNLCHMASAANDYVQSPPLQLAALGGAPPEAGVSDAGVPADAADAGPTEAGGGGAGDGAADLP